jgi:hypothetical protein
MQQSTITFIVAGVGIGGAVLTHFLTKISQDERTRREERRREYRELLSTLTKSYMRIVSPYEPAIPVIDELLQRQITDAKLESFQVLRDRLAIAQELAETNVSDLWTEAIVSLERNCDSVAFAKKFNTVEQTIVRMANRPPPKRRFLATAYFRLRYYRQLKRLRAREPLRRCVIL